MAVAHTRSKPRQVAPSASDRMRGIRQRGTAPELAVRSALSTIGLRYRLNDRRVPGSPDLFNKSRQFAVFVHGCFWHRHAGCFRSTFPRTNATFWRAKFRANVRRDARKADQLRSLGYAVFVVWECETEDALGLQRKLRRAFSKERILTRR